MIGCALKGAELRRVFIAEDVFERPRFSFRSVGEWRCWTPGASSRSRVLSLPVDLGDSELEALSTHVSSPFNYDCTEYLRSTVFEAYYFWW